MVGVERTDSSYILVHWALYVPLEDEPSILAVLSAVIHKLIPCMFYYLSEMC